MLCFWNWPLPVQLKYGWIKTSYKPCMTFRSRQCLTLQRIPVVLAILLQMLVIWFFQVRLLFIWTPRNLADSTCLIFNISFSTDFFIALTINNCLFYIIHGGAKPPLQGLIRVWRFFFKMAAKNAHRAVWVVIYETLFFCSELSNKDSPLVKRKSRFPISLDV